jgi:hypothetical protein
MWFVIGGVVAVVGAAAAWRRRPGNSGAPGARDAARAHHGAHADAHAHSALHQGQNLGGF